MTLFCDRKGIQYVISLLQSQPNWEMATIAILAAH